MTTQVLDEVEASLLEQQGKESNSSSHAIAIPCNELDFMPCFPNNEASTSSSTCVDTNHVEENKELKAQFSCLKNDLEKCHQGKSSLDKMLSSQKSPNDKSWLGFNSNNKKKSNGSNKVKNNKKKGQEQLKN